jgi:hypothetical protein
MQSSNEYKVFEKIIRPWLDDAKNYLKKKCPQLIVKNALIAACIVVKLYRVKLILYKSSKIGFGITRVMQGGLFCQASSELAKFVSHNGMQVLCETVATAGGNLNASSKVFKDSLFNKTTWSLTAGIFIAELGLLSYQRFVANDKIDDQTYKRRVMASFFSNAAGVLGGSSGAFIGCFIGNLITPGIGGYIGSLIGGFLT